MFSALPEAGGTGDSGTPDSDAATTCSGRCSDLSTQNFCAVPVAWLKSGVRYNRSKRPRGFRIVEIDCMNSGQGFSINHVSVFKYHVDLAEVVYVLQRVGIKHE